MKILSIILFLFAFNITNAQDILNSSHVIITDSLLYKREVITLINPKLLTDTEFNKVQYLFGDTLKYINKPQSFKVKINKANSTYFLSNSNTFELNFYIVLNDSTVYKLPDFFYRNCCLEDISAIAFTDINSDGYTDIIVSAEFYRGYGIIESKYAPQYFADVYFGSESGFYLKADIPPKIEGLKSIKAIKKILLRKALH